jgi:putative ABC transport system ATP-binding protein
VKVIAGDSLGRRSARIRRSNRKQNAFTYTIQSVEARIYPKDSDVVLVENTSWARLSRTSVPDGWVRSELTILRLDHVSKDYTTDGAAVRALHDISLEVGPGELAAVVGRSGCGKSTLLNLAGAMDFPTSGQVFVDGVDTRSLGDSALTRLRREKIGFIFQSFQLLPALSVVENVELPLMLAGRVRVREMALERLRQVEMADYASRMPYQLSGGQMQRVAIARALVDSPRLLLADEPTGNLDSTTGDLILDLLRRIANEQGTAVVMATHSAEAANIADTVVRLRDGRVEAVCPTAQWPT